MDEYKVKKHNRGQNQQADKVRMKKNGKSVFTILTVIGKKAVEAERKSRTRPPLLFLSTSVEMRL